MNCVTNQHYNEVLQCCRDGLHIIQIFPRCKKTYLVQIPTYHYHCGSNTFSGKFEIMMQKMIISTYPESNCNTEVE